MKKSLFLAALAGLAMVGCANIERDIDQNPVSEIPITFSSPVMAPNTRAIVGEISDPYPQGEQFKVYAKWYTEAFDNWANGTLYMNEVTTKYQKVDPAATSGAWFPETNYYWPKTGKLTFLAYSPSTVVATNTATGLQITDFTVPANGYTATQQGGEAADTQYDLMYSDLAKDKTSSTGTGSPYEGVDLNFHHALSSVQFTVKTAADYSADKYAIKLKSLTIEGINNKGTFNQNIGSAAAWTGQTGSASYTVLTDVAVPVTSTETNLISNSVGRGLILLPQELGTGHKATLVWTMQKNDGEVIEQTSELKLKTEAVPAGKGALTKWEMGKRYVYNIVIGLDKIYFNPIVSDWVNEESLNTDLQ